MTDLSGTEPHQATVEVPVTEFGWLLAFALSSLPAHPPLDGKCCPHVCGPCAALARLDPRVIRDALLAVGGTSYPWWDPAAGDLDHRYLAARWCDPQTCPAGTGNC